MDAAAVARIEAMLINAEKFQADITEKMNLQISNGDVLAKNIQETNAVMGNLSGKFDDMLAKFAKLNTDTKTQLHAMNEKLKAQDEKLKAIDEFDRRLANIERSANEGARGSDEPNPKKARTRAGSEDAPRLERSDQPEVGPKPRNDDDRTIVLLGFKKGSDKETRRTVTEGIIKKLDPEVNFSVHPARLYGTIVFVKFDTPDEAKTFLRRRHQTGEARPNYTPEGDGNDVIDLRWDPRKDDKKLRKERATGKLASVFHKIGEEEHDGLWDVKCERGPGVVYVNRMLVTKVTIDEVNAPKLDFIKRTLDELGLKEEKLTHPFQKLWLD